jgi:hypothetical protein
MKMLMLALASLATSGPALAQPEQRPQDLRSLLQQRTAGAAAGPRHLSEQERAELRRQLAQYSRLTLPARVTAADCKPAFPCPSPN